MGGLWRESDGSESDSEASSSEEDSTTSSRTQTKITHDSLRRTFKRFDVEDSQLLNFTEFKNCWNLLEMKQDSNECWKAFKHADKSDTDYLNFREFSRAILKY